MPRQEPIPGIGTHRGSFVLEAHGPAGVDVGRYRL